MRTSFKIFIFLIFLFIGAFLIKGFATLPKISQPQIEQEIKVSLRLNFGQGIVKNFENLKLEKEKTVFDLLKKVTQENNLEFSFKEYPDLGVFIESIDNFANDPRKNFWWQYWVNGKYSKVGASNFILKNGDVVEWKYIESQF